MAVAPISSPTKKARTKVSSGSSACFSRPCVHCDGDAFVNMPVGGYRETIGTWFDIQVFHADFGLPSTDFPHHALFVTA